MAIDDLSAVKALLVELNQWRHTSGFDPTIDTNSSIRSTGESNAAIENLKHKLDQLGIHYHWNERDQEYQIDAIEPASSREEQADEPE